MHVYTQICIQSSRTDVFLLVRFILIPPDHVPPDLTTMNLCDPHYYSLVKLVRAQFAINQYCISLPHTSVLLRQCWSLAGVQAYHITADVPMHVQSERHQHGSKTVLLGGPLVLIMES